MSDVTIKLSMGSFAIEVTGPAEYAEKKVEELVGRYFAAGKTAAADTTSAASPLGAAGKPVSAAEFLKKVGQKNQTDRGLVLGYYLEHMRSQPSFTTSGLGDLGIEVKQPFSNISDIVSRLVSRGLMMS